MTYLETDFKSKDCPTREHKEFGMKCTAFYWQQATVPVLCSGVCFFSLSRSHSLIVKTLKMGLMLKLGHGSLPL